MDIKSASCLCHEVWNYTRQEMYIAQKLQQEIWVFPDLNSSFISVFTMYWALPGTVHISIEWIDNTLHINIVIRNVFQELIGY